MDKVKPFVLGSVAVALIVIVGLTIGKRLNKWEGTGAESGRTYPEVSVKEIRAGEDGRDTIVLSSGKELPAIGFQAKYLTHLSTAPKPAVMVFKVASCKECDAKFELVIWGAAPETYLRVPYPGQHTLVTTDSNQEAVESVVRAGLGTCGTNHRQLNVWKKSRLVDAPEGRLRIGEEWSHSFWRIEVTDEGKLVGSEDTAVVPESLEQHFATDCQALEPEDTREYL